MARKIIVSESQYYGLLDLVETELRRLGHMENRTLGPIRKGVKKELAYFRRLRTRLLNKQELVR